MRKIVLFLFTLFMGVGYSQSELKYMVVPNKFSFAKKENPYGVSTTLKFYFEKLGYKTFIEGDKMPADFNVNRCGYLFSNLVESNGFFKTKITIEVRDCQDVLIAKSQEGTSIEKEFKKAYQQALRNATETFVFLENTSVAKEELTVVPISNDVAKGVILAETIQSDLPTLYAQPIENGYQLVDTTPKKVMKIFKTSQPDYFTAISDESNGVLFKKEGVWVFEYYKDNVLKSEKMNIKF